MRDTEISKRREIKGPNTRYSGSLYLKLVIWKRIYLAFLTTILKLHY